MLELLQCGKRCGTQTAEIENRRWRELEMGLAVKHCPWKRGNEGTRNPGHWKMPGAESERLNIT